MRLQGTYDLVTVMALSCPSHFSQSRPCEFNDLRRPSPGIIQYKGHRAYDSTPLHDHREFPCIFTDSRTRGYKSRRNADVIGTPAGSNGSDHVALAPRTVRAGRLGAFRRGWLESSAWMRKPCRSREFNLKGLCFFGGTTCMLRLGRPSRRYRYRSAGFRAFVGKNP